MREVMLNEHAGLPDDSTKATTGRTARKNEKSFLDEVTYVRDRWNALDNYRRAKSR